jgi:hypothetical protein
MKRLPLWAGIIGALWMVVAINALALRAIFFTNYLGLRTGMMLPSIGREIAWPDIWIFNSWLVVSSGIQWALVALGVQVAIRKLSK